MDPKQEITIMSSEDKPEITEGNLDVESKAKSVDKSTNKVVKGSGVTLPYANYKDMDEANKNAADVLASQGSDAAVDYMFTDQKTGRKLSYAEMRGMYG